MFNLKKLLQVMILVSTFTTSFSASVGVTAFSITPLTMQTTVHSMGQTSVKYTVINNASSSLPNINITPGWNSAGESLSLSSDNCSNQTLASGGSCTFDVTIPGENQPNSFNIQPKVCGFQGQLCSQAASIVSVNAIQRSLVLRVYEVIFPAGSSTEKLVGINIDDTSDIIQATISGPSTDGPLAISPDGSKVYMTHNNGDNTYNLLVFDVTANSLTQEDTSYSLSYNGKNLSLPGQIAISPNGETAYITNSGFSGIGYPVYRVDLSSASPSTAVTGISDETAEGVALSPRGIVVSPDGETVYLSNSSSDTNNIFSFPNSSSTTSLSTIAGETGLTAIRALLIASDGSTLYAAGQSSAENFPAIIEQYNIADNFNVENTFLPEPADNGNVTAAALSPDDMNIYSIVNNAGTYYLYFINTTTMTASSGAATFPYGVIFGIFNFPYIAYSPSGSTVSITNYGDSGSLTALFNPGAPGDVSTVNPAGGELTMYSYTRGPFIN